ncbi:unnamed protein product (macronuclear) [Paramecium tetraurelia]|uniref:Elongator complex protein 5 n=1 Tax=Paramecium tetraurelia TaxID=5888 RepID=A0BKE1_PARTE|nr:uncharacterized protein GSPATT00029639001 [Paramecium tetraurelia]CAK59008.1 unnamed protein product [Paramecium tetraurelia]|eukprot:XP_001426406.1 hypothetical protein (macronuclear) [Paramecium tetraurelia strain d4-2]
MQQSQTILNYLNGNYLLTSSTENQVVTLEFDSQYYSPCFHFLHYQLFNHLNSTRPLLIIDLEFNFRSLWKNIYSSIEYSEQNGFKKYVNNMYFINKEDSLNEVLKQIVADNIKSLEVLISGVELTEISIFNMIREILKQPFRSQISVLIPKEFKHRELKTIQSISNCRMIIEQLLESDEKIQKSEKEFKIYNLMVTMVLKKSNGHSFLKNYIIDGKELLKTKLKINKIKKEIKKDDQLDVTKKIGATFNLNLSQEQKMMKNEIDNQINPYKEIISQENVPLIYQNEGDEKRIILDDEQEDFEEVEEYEG